MPAFLCLFFLLVSLPVQAADGHERLFAAAGWPQQREHFHAALRLAQERYRDSLPAGVFQALVDNSNRRFRPAGMDARALDALRARLDNPGPALAFFESALGRKVVAAEVASSSTAGLRRAPPAVTLGDARRAILQRLARALPASEASVEVSLALAGVAADSLSGMLPGLPLGMASQGALEGQRTRLRQQVEPRLLDGLAQVYRTLSDEELERFARFAESAEGQRYYRAALAALRASLRPDG